MNSLWLQMSSPRRRSVQSKPAVTDGKLRVPGTLWSKHSEYVLICVFCFSSLIRFIVSFVNEETGKRKMNRALSVSIPGISKSLQPA